MELFEDLTCFDNVPKIIPMAPVRVTIPSRHSRRYEWALAVTSANNCAKVTGAGRHILRSMCPLFTGQRVDPTWFEVKLAWMDDLVDFDDF